MSQWTRTFTQGANAKIFFFLEFRLVALAIRAVRWRQRPRPIPAPRQEVEEFRPLAGELLPRPREESLEGERRHAGVLAGTGARGGPDHTHQHKRKGAAP